VPSGLSPTQTQTNGIRRIHRWHLTSADLGKGTMTERLWRRSPPDGRPGPPTSSPCLKPATYCRGHRGRCTPSCAAQMARNDRS